MVDAVAGRTGREGESGSDWFVWECEHEGEWEITLQTWSQGLPVEKGV